MFDINQIEKEAREELSDELGKIAKGKIKGKLREIANAESILTNLRAELEVIKRDIGIIKVAED